ncbi:hypothetical protein ROTAS13_03632 [Roseomonas sp. TAS13]|jgi:hypothetical protein|uniref:hypothetical protein n=1 Tax=Roseomonas sp. TAS13 TaxID=1926319 RepID=UPI00095C1F00|nr:hypothetical protein [Roseomonas sp. TAS13]USQ74327.1 hypothetical protein NF552_23510 [Roseomonas mucosa]GAV35949.1 hypothetical protein ROTAS13_03632 [Roseomonas sp. TAS13]
MRHLGGNDSSAGYECRSGLLAAFARLTPARTTTKLTTPLANTPHTSRDKGSLIGNYDAKATSIDLGDGAIIVVHDTTVQASDFIFA